ncbi:MAG: RHS repeat-associated core domain-containing protein [Anaerolineaceae bacterium]
MIEYIRSTSDYETGTLVSITLYEPWEVTRYQTGTNITDYAYTGQMREGDIYYYGARWYDPSIGRFMQADTIVPMASQGTQAFDRYAYVNNNPLRYIDPTGQWCRSTNLMMSDGGGASIEGYLNNVDNDYYWNVRGEWTINELAQLNDFGIKLANRISSINDGGGLEWIQHNTAGMVIEMGTFGQEALIFFLNLLSRQRIAGTVPSITNSGQVYIDSNYFSDDPICHEMTHVTDNVMGQVGSLQLGLEKDLRMTSQQLWAENQKAQDGTTILM